MIELENRPVLELSQEEVGAILQKMERQITPSEVRDAVLEAGVWQFGDYIFASGKTANNKFNAESLVEADTRPQLLTVLAALGQHAVKYNIDALWGVPYFGQELARGMSQVLDVPLIELRKDIDKPNEKTFSYVSLAAMDLALHAPRKVGFEDVTTTLVSIRGALEIPELLFDSQAVVAVWDRGNPATRQGLPDDIAFHALVEAQVSNHITSDHPFYREFGHLAVGKLRATE